MPDSSFKKPDRDPLPAPEADEAAEKQDSDTQGHVVSKKDDELLAISAIEAEEAVPTATVSESDDPDQEVTVKPQAWHLRTPWWKTRLAYALYAGSTVLVVVLAVPFTRYLLLGWAWHKEVAVIVQDARTKRGVADANVAIGGRSATTDSTGKAVIADVPLGYHTVTATKQHYKPQEAAIAVDVITTGSAQVHVAADGTVVSFVITDALSGDPVVDAVVASGGTRFGASDSAGRAEALIPTGTKELPITITSAKHNVLKTAITTKTTSARMVPAGVVYFLEKQDGKLNVMKANYDGSARKVIVPGTGSETDDSTALVMSRDWKYGALYAKRAPNKPNNLYVVTTTDDKYAVIDDAAADYTLYGWVKHHFIYLSTKQKNAWREKTTALKSYNAETGQTVTLDENLADPASTDAAAAYQLIGVDAMNSTTIAYRKMWVQTGEKAPSITNRPSVLMSIAADGTERKTLKEFPPLARVSAKSGGYGLAYYSYKLDRGEEVYSHVKDGVYEELKNPSDTVKNDKPVYLASPDGTKALWTDETDGSNKVMLGDAYGNGGQVLTKSKDMFAYAWISDDRILLRNHKGELFITTINQLKKGGNPLKMSDGVVGWYDTL